MNRWFLLCSLVVIAFLGSMTTVAQIPNPGLEQWTSGNPDGWFTDNVPGFAVPVTASSTSHSGSFSAQLEVVDFGGSPYEPFLWSVFPVSQRHATLTFWVQFVPIGGDGAAVQILLYNNQTPIAAGYGETYEGNPAWEQVTIDLEYFSPDMPDSCYITFIVMGDSLSNPSHVGSVARVDDLAFSGIVSVDDPQQQPLAFALDQNYPNPFNPTTHIRFEVAGSERVTLKVFDLLGREVATLVDHELPPGNHSVIFNGAGLASGTYIYRLQAGNLVESRRMLLLR